MRAPRRFDDRRTAEHLAELRRHALAVLSGDGLSPPIGPITEAILAVAARIGEEVSRRLDKVPLKQAANFYTEAGIGRDPARPARLPVAFKLSDSVVEPSSAPRGTRLMAAAEDGPVIFETAAGIDLIPGAVVAVRGLDANADAVSSPADVFAAGRPPRPEPILRRLASAAAAGATKLQIDPAAKLDAGMLIEIGEGEAARQHKVVKVEGSLVTIEPPLEAGVLAGAPAAEAAEFAPFAGATRNRQEHAFYLGHSKLLDLPSEVTIHVTGLSLPDSVEWSWWGKAGEDDPPAWQDLERLPATGLQLRKRAGKPAKTKVGGHETLWLRALLPGKSMASSTAQGITLAVGGEACSAGRDKICRVAEKLTVGFDAIANTTPVVVNQPFHPFGREPRLYDSFYVGSDEAFSKAGADISLCFRFGGPDLGAIAAVALSSGPQLFGVGSSGLLYRADFSGDRRQLQPLPPVPGEALYPLKDAAGIDARSDGIDIRVAIGTKGAVYLAVLKPDSKLTPDSVTWLRLPTADEDKDWRLGQVVISPGLNPTVYALAHPPPANGPPLPPKLLAWSPLAEGARPRPVNRRVEHLIAVQGQEAVLVLEYPEGIAATRKIGIRRPRDPDFVDFPAIAVDDLPPGLKRLSAYAAGFSLEAEHIFLAALDADQRLRLLKRSGQTRNLGKTVDPIGVDLPISFSPNNPAETDMRLIIASSQPLQFRKVGANLVAIGSAMGIGPSDNPERRIAFAGGKAFTQHADGGLFYRTAAAHGLLDELSVQASPLYLAEDSAGALADILAAGRNSLNGGGYYFGQAIGNLRRLLRLDGAPIPPSAEAEEFTFFEIAERRQATRGDAALLTLSGAEPTGDSIVIQIHRGNAPGLWELWRTEEGWTGTNLPGDDGDEFDCDLLQSYEAIPILPAVSLQDSEGVGLEAIRRRLQRGELLSAADGTPVTSLREFDGVVYAPLPQTLVQDRQLRLIAEVAPWSKLGPDAAANPALSWEYWNGTSWWALAPASLTDGTADFQENGGVFFKVPADLAPTDVAGKKSHWIRARLIGGDYGEAQVTVTTSDKGGGKTEQVAKRDTSTIRAPYVTLLQLGYCALDPVRPEIVLTQDNLGYVDQTSANDAALEFPLFVPVAEAMNPRPATPEKRATSGPGGCGDPCVEPAETERDPCAQPGASDSCDSPCPTEPGAKPVEATAAAGFQRGLMIGLDHPFKGNDVSIYFEAAPGGQPATLAAEMLRDGRFVPVRVVADTSHGLTESGLVTLALPASPDRSDRLGASAHWLRLRPKFEASRWSPRLRGLHLNAVVAESIETRRMERIGTSDATPNQTFRLAEAPVAPDTLELRIRESLEDAERAAPGADVATFERTEGEWVRWKIGDPESADDAARVFSFDSEQGAIRFGDGLHGRIPPLGAELLAVGYAKVHGSRANDVAAGAGLQPISPLAGVESVLALDPAAGGTDAETVTGGVRRAAAKVRHGGRIVSLADVEEVAATLVPGIAQVRAERRRGGVRLIVVGGREGHGWLRQMRSQIAEMSGYGLARLGGLDVVGPRYLELGIEIDLEPPRADLFSDAATRAVEAVTALFHSATGGHDGKGWPLGRPPDESDVAAALVRIEELATPARIALFRIDKRMGSRSELPKTLPSDVIVRLDPTSLVVERAAEAAA